MFANRINNAEAEKCLLELQAGDRGALEELYALTGAFVYSCALSILRSPPDAEDVQHDCFLRILSEPESYVPEGKPLAWMYRIVKNLCLMKLRERKRLTPVDEPDALRQAAPDNANMTAEDRLILMECMNALSPEENSIVVLHVIGGFKHIEIAKLLEMKLPTVISKYRRALKKLRKELEK